MDSQENDVVPLIRHSIRNVSEREIAIALVITLAQSNLMEFSLMGFYDDDHDFLCALADSLSVKMDKAFHNKLTRIVRRLVSYGILYSSMRNTDKWYTDEPSKQMNYGFVNAGKRRLLSIGETEHTGTPEWEAAFLLRHVYPVTEHQ